MIEAKAVRACAALRNDQSSWSVCRAFNQVARELSGVVSSPIVEPLAAWMPPTSTHGRVHGVSRDGERARSGRDGGLVRASDTLCAV
ncbi:hypothetical protein CVO74_15910 [Xanthomonas prunicola]|uniref:Uncharacterized protein n=1 Tax=Xanthomonas prunicola TaxID=2053930 RepID=A0A2N3RH59_9XANT|nr:hypothetical protein XpruCFBP8353_16645 [Xanthomonas prunicola]PKV15967.1 hypothetical protein XpruCFBP8354_15780 [Xanthomonas prunicola]PKV20230.1 hypothetical protein CVO74_15910 [Xanthomonas prunicola]